MVRDGARVASPPDAPRQKLSKGTVVASERHPETALPDLVIVGVGVGSGK